MEIILQLYIKTLPIYISSAIIKTLIELNEALTYNTLMMCTVHWLGDF